jgi:voltage-gated potassium channel Kch
MSTRPGPGRDAGKSVFTARQKLRYRFDNTLSRGSTSLILWLAAITLALILIGASILAIVGVPDPQHVGRDAGFLESFWLSLLRAIDPGTMGSDVGWPFRVVSLFVTIGGLFIAGSLIGLLASAINRRVEELQAGRTIVAEHGHTLILGWSSKVFTMVSELAIANENQPGSSIVILAPVEKIWMEEQVQRRIPDTKATRVICRTGSPQDFSDLQVANAAMAKSVIVLSSPDADGDAGVVKAALAVTNGPWKLDPSVPVVVELAGSDNADALRRATEGRVTVVQSSELIARLTAQVCRQPGLSKVYTELFDFDGDEIYFHSDAGLAGSTYGEAQLALESVTVIGLLDEQDVARLNPPQGTVIGNSQLIVVVEDDSALATATASTAAVVESLITGFEGRDETPSQALLIGWNERAAAVVRELDAYAEPGSELVVLTEFGTPDLPPLTNLTATLERGRTTDRATLERFVHGDLDQVIVLCYSEQFPTQQADARTLVTLLHVREIVGDEIDGPAVVSEMLDDRNRALAEVAQVDDVIVSDQILSLMLSQLSEDARLAAVFADLLDADGAEIYLRPAEWYVAVGEEANFATVVAAAARRGETALGYRSLALAHEDDGGSGVRINPAKSATFSVAAGDRVVVLAEE